MPIIQNPYDVGARVISIALYRFADFLIRVSVKVPTIFCFIYKSSSFPTIYLPPLVKLTHSQMLRSLCRIYR
ncbi:hypothetical protein EV146_107256 [Mesobacillus foraminis]|uniref:Uncharacterized protein n=1 Tax=Mesobacillus foraminis TaxID=279826 RepID=A0A4R2BDR0_9BACI|nr:hypothetical protein EV146_107256 [Mesobacillus foraminis]